MNICGAYSALLAIYKQYRPIKYYKMSCSVILRFARFNTRTGVSVAQDTTLPIFVYEHRNRIQTVCFFGQSNYHSFYWINNIVAAVVRASNEWLLWTDSFSESLVIRSLCWMNSLNCKLLLCLLLISQELPVCYAVVKA